MTFENPVIIKKGGVAEDLTINKADLSSMFYQLPAGTVLPEEVILYLPNTTNLMSAVRQSGTGYGLKKLTLSVPSACIFAYFLTYNSDLEELTFLNGVTTNASVTGFLGSYSVPATALKKVTGEIRLSGYSGLTDFCNAPNLREIRFAANCITMNANFPLCKSLSAESLASIGNALNSANPSTLTLHADSKTICNNTLGTVDGSGLFVIDPSGTMTLWDFITQTKGWTIS